MIKLSVGRSSDNDVVIDNPYVGRKHCNIIKNDDGTYMIEDLSSRNGTFVNGRKIRGTVRLKAGDVVKLANQTVLSWCDCFKNEPPVEKPVEPTSEPSAQTESTPVFDTNPMLYDCQKNPEEVYGIYEKQMLDIMDAYRTTCLLPEILVSPSHYSGDIMSLAINEYRKNFSDLVQMGRKVEDVYSKMKAEYDDDMQKMDNLYQYTLIGSRDVNASMSTIRLINEKKLLTQNLYIGAKDKVLNGIKRICKTFEDKHPVIYPHKYELAVASDNCWRTQERAETDFQNILYMGESRSIFNLFDESFSICKREYQPFLTSRNLLLYYNGQTKRQCMDVVNTMAGRLLMSMPSGLVKIHMVDANDWEGTCSEFKRLHGDVFKIYAQPADILGVFDNMMQHVENVIQNMLYGSTATLADYNGDKTNKEPYRLLIIKDFPCGIFGEALARLKKLISIGARAGVSIVLMINEDEVKRTEDSLKMCRMLNPEYLEEYCAKYNFVTSEFPCGKGSSKWEMNFEILSDDCLYDIVRLVNKGFEVKAETVIKLTDYLPKEKDWWSGRSASLIEVPFGISSNKSITPLRITQESGQNSAIVIGIPGSGKSVFLHTVIASAAVHYSPKELQMYLLDFSGVEFNVYANHKLPHARVIAPEAEREFGLSILREVFEEGSRRMTLCRENGVTNIVELKRNNPDMVVPRLLVIIDEFQKIFEVDNDNISKEANVKIHAIIQEYRKFGINLILATQKLPAKSIVPYDLIANRVVFKADPNDFSNLIKWPHSVPQPRLLTGICVYNNESGAEVANNITRSFFINASKELENLLDKVSAFAQAHPNMTDKHELRTFRSDELPEFGNRIMSDRHREHLEIPREVGVYVGESIAISPCHVYVPLTKDSNNNILVIGGMPNVAKGIAYHALISEVVGHTEKTCNVIMMNFMMEDDPMRDLFRSETFAAISGFCAMKEVNSKSTEDVKDYLQFIKNNVVDARKNDPSLPLKHFYINIFEFQRGRMFDGTGGRGDMQSECASLLEYIIKNGPMVGVFTVLQVDNLANLNHLCYSAQNMFCHRIALQMSEQDSDRIVGNSAANKLLVLNRPATNYRALYYNNINNSMTKFKPYGTDRNK